MAKGFVNIDSIRKQMTETVVPSTVKSIINNPYYLFTDKTASVCKYYNLNTTMTTLDVSTRSNYGELTAQSPLRFNKINGFYIYGISKIEPSLNVDEYGLEGDTISGEAIILPNTITPYPGDRFILDQLGDKYIFQVTGVSPNTLETGSTMYKVEYSLCGSDGIQSIEDKVIKTFSFIANNVGTNFNCVMEDSTLSDLRAIQDMSNTLKDYFIDIFYDARIQGFAYYKAFAGFKVYDSYMTEFLMSNKILSGATQYIHIDHQMFLSKTFGVDYDRTFFRTLETCDAGSHIGNYTGNILFCNQKFSLLYAYPQDYYYMEFNSNLQGLYLIDIFNDPSFGNKVVNNIKTGDPLKDIIIGYFHNESITKEQLNALKHIDYMDNESLFYLIPMVIFVMDKAVSSTLTNA